MSMEKPKVLLIGESSTISYLTWALTVAKWPATAIPLNEKRTQLDQPWYFFENSETFEYSPHKAATDIQGISALGNSATKFDVIVATHISFQVLEANPTGLDKFIDNDTVFLVDSNEDIWISAKFSQLYPSNVVLSMYSDGDFRKLSEGSNCFRLMNDFTTIKIGTTSSQNDEGVVKALVGISRAGEKLSKFTAVFNEDNASAKFMLLPKEHYYRLAKIIWKNMIRIICFETLSIIFEEPDILLLARQINVAPLMKGIFQELLMICQSLEVRGLPLPFTEGSKKLLQSSILLESNKRMKRTIVCADNKEMYPKFIDATTLFYNFSQGIEVDIIGLLLKLLQASDEFSIETPFLESTYSFMNRLITIRDGIDSNGNLCPSKLFQVKKIQNDSNTLRIVNGIPPTKNMMNFPPFNPPPLPNPPTQCFFNSSPLVFMSEIRQHKNSNTPKGNTDAKVANNLDTFYDAESQLDDGGKNRPAIQQQQASYQSRQNTNSSHQDLNIQAMPNLPPNQVVMNGSTYYLQQNGQYYASPNPVTYQQQKHNKPMHPYASSLSNFAAPSNASHVPNYQHRNAGQTFVNNNGSFSIPKKRQSFFHASVPITRKTSSHKLRQSHASLLEMIQFDDLMDKTTSSRYGVDLDTSSTVLNSANNSRGSKASSSRTSSKIQSPKPQLATNGNNCNNKPN